MEIQDILITITTPVAQVALIMAIAQLLKGLGLKKKWIPVADVVIGLISGIFVYGIMQGYGIGNGILLGLALGLSACGLFSGVKNLRGE